MYYCDITVINGTILAMYDNESEDNTIDNLAHVSTVKSKMEGYTQRQIKDATTARKFQNSAGFMTTGLLSLIDK